MIVIRLSRNKLEAWAKHDGHFGKFYENGSTMIVQSPFILSKSVLK